MKILSHHYITASHCPLRTVDHTLFGGQGDCYFFLTSFIEIKTASSTWWLLEKILEKKNQKDSGRLEAKMTEMKKYFCPPVYQI